MYVPNPYPASEEDRHPVQFYISRADWEYFQLVTGQRRGLAANLAATFFQTIITEFNKLNLSIYDHAPRTDSALRDIVQRTSIRLPDGSGRIQYVSGSLEDNGPDDPTAENVRTDKTGISEAR